MTKKYDYTGNLMPLDAIRLHFWSENKSCYVVTDCISDAISEMKLEYDSYSIATNQDMEIKPTDTVLYYL